MRILNRNDIMETIGMLTDENLDVRTVTMGISLLDCIDPDGEKACEKIYNKITRLAGSLVSTVDSISSEYGIPIVNKRISVTPIAMLLGAAPDADPVMYAKALDRAAKAVGVHDRVRVGGGAQQHGNGRNADALVHDGNTVPTSSAASARWCKGFLPVTAA